MIPLVYGTSNLDSVKSADCLERMVALIGLPMFVPLLKPEQEAGMDAVITLRTFPYRVTAALRIVLSLICTAALILAFEGYMRTSGCSFPLCTYTPRTLTAAAALGFAGLLASAVSGNTAAGSLLSFCWYCAGQTESIGAGFKPVSMGIRVDQVLLLLGSGAAILLFAGGPLRGKRRRPGR